MAQKFLSPGVFTTEVDQSFLAQGVAGIGATLIGRTSKGPALVPTFLQGFDQFASVFGPTDPDLQLPYTAQNYLKNSTSLTVIRVLGHADGTNTTNGYTVGYISSIADSGSLGGNIGAVVHSQYPVSVTPVNADINNFVFQVISGSTAVFSATASFLTSSTNYIGKVLNQDPTMYSTYKHYLYQNFKFATLSASGHWATNMVTGSTSFLRDFTAGSTTYVKSQALGGNEFDLFRFHTRPHGRATNDEFKVTLRNIKESPNKNATPWGTFDVVIRDFYDTDQRQTIMESFIGCTLDPNSPNYILRKIGDMVELFDTTQRKFVASGQFPAQSKLVWIELSPNASAAPAEALPWGFHGFSSALTAPNSGSVTAPSVPSLPYTVNQRDRNGNIDQNINWGVSFVSGGIADRMRAESDSVNSTDTLKASDTDFSLKFLSSSYVNGKQLWSYNPASTTVYDSVYQSASIQCFTMPFAGGFDGFDLRVEDPLYLNNVDDDSVIGVVSLKRAIDTVSNPDAFDMNLLALPGIHNLKSCDYARLMVNNRMDAMYVMDITGASVPEAIGQLKSRELDDNYTACYYPDLKLNDTVNNKIVRVSPSVAIMGTLAFSDRVSQPWFAPAGFNRGGLGQFNIIDVADRLTFGNRDDLYSNRINPIAIFPAEGVTVLGQKTLQVAASALDRINVRRLLIYAKKTVASAAKFLLFEPDNPTTWQRFTNLVNPILEKVRQDQGLDRFKVVMDSTTNTPDVVDRNVMVGKIFLQPTKSAEFIDLSFIITNAGVSFGD